MFFKISESIYTDYTITKEPYILANLDFFCGIPIEPSKIASPLLFETNCDDLHPPKNFLQLTIPVFSNKFLSLLKSVGVDNLQIFPAELQNNKSALTWEEFAAVNIVGLVDCADLINSQYVTIDAGGGVYPPLVSFDKLVIDEKKVDRLLLFRVLNSPSILIAHEDIIAAMKKLSPAGGWGISVTKLKSTES